MKILIIIWIVSFMIEIINFIIGRKKLLKALKEPQCVIIKEVFSDLYKSASWHKWKKMMTSPYSYFIYGLIGFIISPFLVPITLWLTVKDWLKIKTKLDRQIEQESADMKQKEDLIAVVKEANKDISELKKNWVNDDDMKKHYKPFHERVKNQCENLDFFISICVQDITYNFIGGAILNQNGDTIIDIK